MTNERVNPQTGQKKGRRTPRQKHEQSRGKALVFLALLSVLAVFSLTTVCVFYYAENARLKQEAAEAEALAQAQVSDSYTPEEVEQLLAAERINAEEETTEDFLRQLRALMESGNGTVPMLRYFFPEQIVFADGNSYRFVERDESLSMHPYLTENLTVGEDGEFVYYENGQAVSRKGIDVSSFQRAINWQRVADDGVEFAIIRMGLRGFGNGRLVVDEYFERNMRGALDAGLDVGVYFFTAAIDEAEAVEEAEFLLEAMEPYGIRCTVVIDIEDVNNSDARINGLTAAQRTDICIAFCERIKEAGYTPMIYGNLKSFIVMLELPRLEAYDKWFAAYTPYFYYPYDFEVWQYSESGSVNGVQGDVDLNISFYDWQSIVVGP